MQKVSLTLVDTRVPSTVHSTYSTPAIIRRGPRVMQECRAICDVSEPIALEAETQDKTARSVKALMRLATYRVDGRKALHEGHTLVSRVTSKIVCELSSPDRQVRPGRSPVAGGVDIHLCYYGLLVTGGSTAHEVATVPKAPLPPRNKHLVLSIYLYRQCLRRYRQMDALPGPKPITFVITQLPSSHATCKPFPVGKASPLHDNDLPWQNGPRLGGVHRCRANPRPIPILHNGRIRKNATLSPKATPHHTRHPRSPTQKQPYRPCPLPSPLHVLSLTRFCVPPPFRMNNVEPGVHLRIKITWAGAQTSERGSIVKE